MTATTITELRTLSAARQVPDEKMDQVRELLFGEFQRQSDQRLGVLESRIRELEQSMHRRIDALQARLDALSTEVTADQRSSFDEIARGIEELGQRVRRISRD